MMNIYFDEHGYQKVKGDDCFDYECIGCGDCCRDVRDSVMVESRDLFRLSQFFNPLSDDETALLKSTGNKSAVEYETIMGVFTKDLDIRNETIRVKLKGFETAFERIRINEIKTEITGYQNNYESHLSVLRDLTLKIANCRYTLAGLECAVNEESDDSELMEYFMCNKNLSLICASGTLLEFIVHGYADVYDIEAFEQYVAIIADIIHWFMTWRKTYYMKTLMSMLSWLSVMEWTSFWKMHIRKYKRNHITKNIKQIPA